MSHPGAIKKVIVIISQDFRLLCPLECTFALSGRINGVNLQRNIHVGILGA